MHPKITQLIKDNNCYYHEYQNDENQYISDTKNNFTEDEQNFLNHFDYDKYHQSIQKYKKLLEKYKIIFNEIENYGLNFKLSLVGGCVRDTICEKPIKDLDILLTINEQEVHSLNSEYFKKNFNLVCSIEKNSINILIESMDEKMKKIMYPNKISSDDKSVVLNQRQLNESLYIYKNLDLLINEGIIDKNINDEDFKKIGIGTIKHNIVKKCLSKTNITKQIDFSSNSESDYEGVTSLFKIDKLENQIDVDILVSVSSPIKYINLFDYNICKIYAEVNDDNELEILYNKEFLKDYINKKLTLNLDIFGMDLEYKSFMKNLNGHTARMLEKFSDYEVEFSNLNSNSDLSGMFEHRKQLIKIFKNKMLNDRILKGLNPNNNYHKNKI